MAEFVVNKLSQRPGGLRKKDSFSAFHSEKDLKVKELKIYLISTSIDERNAVSPECKNKVF